MPALRRLAVLLATAFALAACGDGSSAETSVPPSGPVDKEIVVTIAKREVNPSTARYEVTAGSLVRITATSDVDDSIHVHGYDKTLELKAGVAGSLDFRAAQTGLFEVETHETKFVLFQLLVR